LFHDGIAVIPFVNQQMLYRDALVEGAGMSEGYYRVKLVCTERT
jgi:hypothetical protein